MSNLLFQSFRAVLRKLVRRTQPVSQGVTREAIEQLVGTYVNDFALYEQALHHRSRLRGKPQGHLLSNERLEFLGDAVLGFVVAEHLFHHFPSETEGFLTRLRAKLVNGKALANYARSVELGVLILMSENMVQSDGRQNQSILADAFEAIIGALYLDRGLESARKFIHRTMLDQVDLVELAEVEDNYKSLLLEYVQRQGWSQPLYRVIGEEGPSHERRFTVEVMLREEAYGTGEAGSKKRAEQRAARQALHRLRSEEA